MTLEEFRKSTTQDQPPAGLSDALAGLWWDAKGIGRARMSRLSRMRVRRARGSTPTYTARRETPPTRATGTTGLTSLIPEVHSIRVARDCRVAAGVNDLLHSSAPRVARSSLETVILRWPVILSGVFQREGPRYFVLSHAHRGRRCSATAPARRASYVPITRVLRAEERRSG